MKVRATALLLCFTNIAIAIPTIQIQSDNLPGLNASQTKYARQIIAENKTQKLGSKGCQVAITMAITDSNLVIYANKNVPESLKYPHDRVGADSSRLGIFQQQKNYYPTVACGMNATCSVKELYKNMQKISNWQNTEVVQLCIKLQVAATVGKYKNHVKQAVEICKASS